MNGNFHGTQIHMKKLNDGLIRYVQTTYENGNYKLDSKVQKYFTITN